MSKRKAGILVLGAGELGKAVLTWLLPRAGKAGIAVDLLVRNPHSDDAKKALSGGATIVQGDIGAASDEELAGRFAKYDTIISCVGFSAGAGTQRKIAQTALQAGCRRFFPWQFGVNYDRVGRGSAQPLFDEQCEVRTMLRAQQQTHWVIVSTGMFTSFLFESAFGVVDLEHSVVRALGTWDTTVTVTTPSDIGKLTAEIVFSEPEINNEVVFLAGETLTYEALAAVVENALGHPVERELWDLAWLEADLAQFPHDTLRRYRAVFAAGRGVSWDKATSFNAIHGIPVTDAATWLAEHLAHPKTPPSGPRTGCGTRQEGL